MIRLAAGNSCGPHLLRRTFSALFVIVATLLPAGSFAETASGGAQSVPAPAPASTGNRALNQVIATSPEHKKSLVALLRGRRDLPEWARSIVTSARYVTGVSRIVTLPEGAFELFGACDPRNCQNSHIRILFSADGSRVWARLVDPKDGQQVLGEPSADQLRALMTPGI